MQRKSRLNAGIPVMKNLKILYYRMICGKNVQMRTISRKEIVMSLILAVIFITAVTLPIVPHGCKAMSDGREICITEFVSVFQIIF